jgi:hypothetical protein
MTDLPEIQDIVRVTYNPDDVIVARVKRLSSWEAGRLLHERLTAAFPLQRIVILDSAVELEVMAPADAPTGLDLDGEPS